MKQAFAILALTQTALILAGCRVGPQNQKPPAMAQAPAAAYKESPGAAPAATPPASKPAAAPAFVAADVHVSPHRNNLYLRGGTLIGDRFMLRDATMVDLIANAYNVDPEQVSGGPAWLELYRFDILAKAPASTSPENVRLMLHTLLADRFKLVAHTAIVPQPAFILTGVAGPALQTSDGTGEPGCLYQQPPKPAAGSAPVPITNIKFLCHNTAMDQFAQFLHGMLGGKPVVNATGLSGAWDFEFHWSFSQSPKPGFNPLTDAVAALGLKLELKTTPLPAVVVDSVNEKPTANAPNLAQILPPTPAESFDVAVIKPSGPNEKSYGFEMNANTINFHHASPLMLIYFAWEIDQDLIVNQPPWLNQDHYSVTAKAPEDNTPRAPGQGSNLGRDEFGEMMRSLLADRFKLAVHIENRPADAYTLVAANPKMKKSDPTVRASCTLGFVADPNNPASYFRQITCRNITMPQFADQLLQLEGSFGEYIKSPVLDATGLTGGYDFVLKFSKPSALKTTAPAPAPVPAATSSDATAPTDPSGAVSLFDAINKQLGLKLEKQRRPVPTLVLDHIEQKPTEN
jgi:uncharacterized protein (TIGR03435 family)